MHEIGSALCDNKSGEKNIKQSGFESGGWRTYCKTHTGKLGFHLSPHDIQRDQKSCKGIRFDVSQDGGGADLNLGRMRTAVM
jgi:hypothetical protein